MRGGGVQVKEDIAGFRLYTHAMAMGRDEISHNGPSPISRNCASAVADRENCVIQPPFALPCVIVDICSQPQFKAERGGVIGRSVVRPTRSAALVVT